MTAHDVTIAGLSAVIDRPTAEELVSIFPLQATGLLSIFLMLSHFFRLWQVHVRRDPAKELAVANRC